MRQPIVILVLTVAPALAAAQASAGAQAEARSKTEVTVQRGELPRIPEGFSAEARARLEAMFETARQKSLPAEPMTNRMAEGQAKGASESEIVAASAITLAQLEMSQSALVRAGRGQPTEAEISRGAQLIARGASSAQLTLLASRDPSDRRLDAALGVLTDLSSRGMPVDRAITAVVNVGATAGLGLGSARKP